MRCTDLMRTEACASIFLEALKSIEIDRIQLERRAEAALRVLHARLSNSQTNSSSPQRSEYHASCAALSHALAEFRESRALVSLLRSFAKRFERYLETSVGDLYAIRNIASAPPIGRPAGIDGRHLVTGDGMLGIANQEAAVSECASRMHMLRSVWTDTRGETAQQLGSEALAVACALIDAARCLRSTLAATYHH